MKSLVIGASGLVGSHLLKTCQARNWDVSGNFHNYAQPNLTFLELSRC
jgi:dTDP-4-dehydrorhamnose reductase